MGRVIMSGIVPLLSKPVKGTKVGTLAVGSSVYLMENNVRTEFLVVNQGNPDASLYDSSCDGCWLLRKDIKENKPWDSSDNNTYSSPSAINTWLNGKYINSLGNIEQQTIRQVKIPYVNGTGSGGSVASGVNGLSVKVFLVGGYEVGWTTSDDGYFPVDGAKLAYFESGTGTSANNKRIAKLNGEAAIWWLRSPRTDNAYGVWNILSSGKYGNGYSSYSLGIRPTLVLPSTAKVDDTGLLIG